MNFCYLIFRFLLFAFVIVWIQTLLTSNLLAQDNLPKFNQSPKDSVLNLSVYQNWLTKHYQAKFEMMNTAQDYSNLGLKFRATGPVPFEFENFNPIFPELYKSNVERNLDLISSGGSSQLLISPAQLFSQFQKKSKWESGKRFHYNLIPSNLQLEVLKTLWENSNATMLELYAALDSSYLITAENLNRQLGRMMQLGMVERRIISPQNLFSIITPFKSFQLEMSGKNRRNKLYLYRPTVPKKRILQLLLTKSYQVINNGGTEAELARINKKINIIASGS